MRDLFKETVLKVCGVRTLDDLPKAVRDVMKKGDYDNDGHPLSVRRIRAVTGAILAEAGKETESTSGGAQIQSAPQIDGEDETDSSVDDDEDVSFEYDTPDYAAGLPPETEMAFMEFYCDAVKETVKDGRTKVDCDNMLREMFKEVGYDKNDRKLLAELLAGGKPRFLDKDGRLPFDFEATRFAKDFKSVLDLTKQYRAKLPKAYGDIVADTILGMLKAGGWMFGADDLKPIDADLCKDIAATAKKIDAGKLLSPPPGKIRGAKSLSRALDGFRREAAEKCAAELLKPNDSELMTKIKQNLLMNLALARGVRPPRPTGSRRRCGVAAPDNRQSARAGSASPLRGAPFGGRLRPPSRTGAPCGAPRTPCAPPRCPASGPPRHLSCFNAPKERLVGRTGRRYNASNPHGSPGMGWLRSGCCTG